jgi:hypothetical protein
MDNTLNVYDSLLRMNLYYVANILMLTDGQVTDCLKAGANIYLKERCKNGVS